MIGHDQYPKFRLSTLSITGLLSLLLLISPLFLFSQDSSPPSSDFDGNGTVGVSDFLLFLDVFGSKEGDEKYESKYDLDGNGEIGISDFLIFGDNFGTVIPKVSISAGITPVTEGTSATFTITANPAPSTALTVRVSVSETGNVKGTSSSSVTINANNTTATLTVTTVNDEVDESNSVITAEVQGGTGYTVGSPSSASVTVEDDDVPQVRISAGTTPVTEGTSATFTITADPAPSTALTVRMNVTETGSVINGTPPSSVTINANNTTATLTVTTVNDEVDESNSVITAEVQGGTGYTVGSPSSASVTVNDNDNPAPPPPPPPPPQTPKVSISAGTTPVTEGTSATFTITANPAPSTALTVRVSVSETGNVKGTSSSSVTINANNTTATLTVTTVNDEVDESNSVITAEVQGGTGYTVGSPSSASVTVEDNDDPAPPPPPPPQTPKVSISAGITPVTEGTSATFTITANPAPSTALTVSVNVSETGPVINGTPPSSVTIDATKTTATLTVATDDDDVVEYDYRVTAEVQGGTGYTVGSPSSASVIVLNNDDPLPVASVEISPSSIKLTKVGNSDILTARILDKNGKETRVTSWGWSSANEEVATVSSLQTSNRLKARVTAIGDGTTTITLSASGQGGTATGTATVTVTVSGPRVEISPRSLTFEALGSTATVTVRVLDENGVEDTDASFILVGLFSPGSEIVIKRVDGGFTVTGNATSRGRIEISSGDARAILPIRVYQKPASLTLSPSSVALTVGGTATLSAAIKDANGHEIKVDQNDGKGGLAVYWETNNSAVATVDGAAKRSETDNRGGTAKVTAKGTGTATITGRWSTGTNSVAGTATITVTD